MIGSEILFVAVTTSLSFAVCNAFTLLINKAHLLLFFFRLKLSADSKGGGLIGEWGIIRRIMLFESQELK